VRVAVEAEEPDRAFGVVEEDQGDGVGPRGPDRDGRLHCFAERGQRRVLKEPQHLDELTGAGVSEIAFQSPAQRGEAAGQLPVLEGTGEVDGTGLALQEGQVVQRIEGGVLFAPVPAVPCHDAGPTGDGDVVDAAEDGHLVVGIGRRHRIVVSVETHE
jgi:hypothetical protein